MLTGATSKEEVKSIFSRLTSGSRAVHAIDGGTRQEIKLCYVTVRRDHFSRNRTAN